MEMSQQVEEQMPVQHALAVQVAQAEHRLGGVEARNALFEEARPVEHRAQVAANSRCERRVVREGRTAAPALRSWPDVPHNEAPLAGRRRRSGFRHSRRRAP